MTRPIDADTLYMNLVKMKDFGELTAKKAIRAVENEPTVDLRKDKILEVLARMDEERKEE